MVFAVAQTSRAKQRLEQAGAWLRHHRAAQKTYILAMCLVYVMHNIWLARTVLWFIVLPIVLISAASYRNLLPIVKSSVFIASALFLAMIIGTSVLGGETPGPLLFKNLRYVVAVLAFLVITAYVVNDDNDFLRQLFLFLAPLAALTAIRDVAFGTESLDTLLSVRLQGVKGFSIYYNSNVIGMMFAMPCVGAVAVMASRTLKRWQYAMLSVSVLILLGAIVLTGSRGCLVAAAAGIGVSILLSTSWRLSAALAAILLVVAGVTLMTPLAGELLQRRDSLRLSLWPVYLEMAMLKPWLGYGLAYDTQRTLPDGNIVMNGHNIFICALVRGGVFSALALAGVVLGSLVNAVRSRKRSGEFLPLTLLATCLAATAVDYEIIPTDLSYHYILFWLPVGLCLGVGLRDIRRTPSRMTQNVNPADH